MQKSFYKLYLTTFTILGLMVTKPISGYELDIYSSNALTIARIEVLEGSTNNDIYEKLAAQLGISVERIDKIVLKIKCSTTHPYFAHTVQKNDSDFNFTKDDIISAGFRLNPESAIASTDEAKLVVEELDLLAEIIRLKAIIDQLEAKLDSIRKVIDDMEAIQIIRAIIKD